MDRTLTRRAALLAASAMTLIVAASPDRAAAQAFAGTPTVNAGSATVATGTGTTTVAVNNPATVITWTPTSTATSGTIDFLPAGTTATFTSTTLGDYTVLNRIVPGGSARIGLNGTIVSTVSSGGASPTAVPGGNVWFYTPNGFIVGAGALISVGGLLLTTNDIAYTIDPASGGAAFTNAAGAVELRAAPGSAGSIVNNGSIVGNNPDAYIAMVAPRIEQRGFVSADRSIAYVAGEQVDLMIDAGMFGITVLTGTSDAEGIVHTGATGGSASTGFFDRKTISFVAIPKNEAMTMLLQGSVGYTPAANAFDDGAAIVLTAGGAGSPEANVRIGTGLYSNRLTADATGSLEVRSTGPNGQGVDEIRFRGEANLSGDRAVTVTAGAGAAIVAERSLELSSQQANGNGGTVTVRALGGGGGLPAGTIEAASFLGAFAGGNGGTSADDTSGFDAIGGAVTIAADGGTISAGSLFAYAGAEGGSGTLSGGAGRGGTVTMTAGYGGSITAGFTSLSTNGRGGGLLFDPLGPQNGAAGAGYGGTVALADSGTALGTDTQGGLLALGSVRLDASADGGYTNFAPGELAGNAFGGTVTATINRAAQSWDDAYVTANAHEGDTAFDPVGGTVSLTVGGGASLAIGSTLILEANALAGVNGGPGAFGRGGTVNLTVEQASTLAVGAFARLDAEAVVGGFFFSGEPATTPDLTGGTVNLRVDGDSLFEARDLYLSTLAYNYGAASAAGFARGGTINLTASNGGEIRTVPDAAGFGGFFQASAEAYGVNGTVAPVVTGGTINLVAQSGGRISSGAGTLELLASGESGFASSTGGNGSDATGGAIAIDAIGGTILSAISADASGEGGDADGEGGDGTGGSIAVRVLSGGTLTGNLGAQASGHSGDSLIAGDGGDGRGGAFSLASDASATFAAFSLDFGGQGDGGEAAAGVGGDGYGGRAQVDVIGGTHDWSFAVLDASAEGAASQGSGSSAGSAYGDAQGIDFHVGGGAALTVRSGLLLDATASTGSNGGANAAIGGAAGLLVDGGASLIAGAIEIGAAGFLFNDAFDPASTDTTPTARGGTASLVADGGTVRAPLIVVNADGETAGALTGAGSATGGTAVAGAANGGAIDNSGSGNFTGLYVHARGLGGEGPSAAHAFGGTATLYTQGGSITTPLDLGVRADAQAGTYAGLFSAGGIASNGFDATGGTASVEMRAGGTGAGAITAPSLTVSAQGLASDLGRISGTGGNGRGGSATLAVSEGTLAAGGRIDVVASGFGGGSDEHPGGGPAFESGDGQGGSAAFVLAGGSATATDVTIAAVGQGAGGTGSSAGATPSLAGDGVGGSARFVASGGSLTSGGASESLFVVTAIGVGGEGAFNPNPGPGGDGGSGTGGSALFEAPAGSTANLAIGSAIVVSADADGGDAGFSADAAYGRGGNGAGGSAAMRLADLPFAFGEVAVGGSGYGGFGATDGTGIGGSAEFALVDSGSASAARSLGALELLALGADHTATGPSGAGGTVTFTARAGAAGAALAIGGDLLLDASGGSAPAGNGIAGTISGAPVTVGGTAVLRTPRDATFAIAAPGALNVTGDLTIDIGRSFTSSGAIATLANASVIAPSGIAMTDLSSGGTTLLRAVSGPVSVTRDLRSGGLVTVLGRSGDLVSLGALSFADANATAGDLSIRTADNLDLVTVDASGAVTLTSTGGNIRNTGAVNGVGITYVAGGDVVSETTVASGGSLTVDAGGTFTAPGTVSAAGDVSLSADLGLALAGVVSGGTTLLRSDAGAVAIGSLTSPGLVTALGRAVTIASPGPLSFAEARATAGDLQLTTAGDLALTQASATGATSLLSSGGTVTAGNLNAGGLVTARGTAVTIGSSGALWFADLDSTAGAVRVETAGNLAVGTVDAAGSITLASTGGALSASAPVNAGGSLTASGLAGVALGAASSGGATALSAPDGAVTVTALSSAGPVSATGRAIDIASPGALTIAGFAATAGDGRVTTVGALTVPDASASGTLTLASSAGSVASSGTLSGAGGAAVSGATGVALNRLASGGQTTLAAPDGALSVAELASAGPVTASGRSVTLASPGPLTVASAQATAGNMAVSSAQALAVGSATATGSLALTAGGDLATTGAISGAGVALTGANVTAAGTVQSSAGLTLSAQQLLSISALATGVTTSATAADIAIGSAGRLGSRGLTRTLTISNRDAARPILFGGAGASGQFSLDRAEAARLFADQQIAIVAAPSSSSGGGEIRIGELALSYGAASTANLGSGATLKVDTFGRVVVNGAVSLTTSSASDTFSIDPTRIEIVGGSGAIAMRGTGGAPLGTLVLEGGTLIAADQAVIDALGSAGDFTAIKRLLDQPTGAHSDAGFLQAGTIDLSGAEALYIQNTGLSTATSARRGFTAGALNLDTGSDTTRIAINGVIAGPTGTLTGRQAIDAVIINGAAAARGGRFDPLSTINGCIIGSPCTAQGAQTSTDLNAPGEGGTGGDGGFGFDAGQLVQLEDTEPLIAPPLVDEPITGVGNDDLWQVHCDPEGDKSECPAQGEETPE